MATTQVGTSHTNGKATLGGCCHRTTIAYRARNPSAGGWFPFSLLQKPQTFHRAERTTSYSAVPSLSLFLRMGSFYKVKTKKGCYKAKTSQNYTVKTPLFPLGIGSSVRCLEPLLDRACARKPMATRGSSRHFFGREKSRLIHAPWAFRGGGGGLELDQPLKTRFLCRIQQSTCGFLENHLPFFVVLGAPVCW